MNELNAVKFFNIEGSAVNVERYGNGHINDTFLVVTDIGIKYILQRVNSNVFKNPEQVMHNIISVTEYLREQAVSGMKTLTLIPGITGEKYISSDGEVWRMYEFLENCVSLELPENENDFYQSAVAFGAFQNMLGAFPADKLFETIPNFHNTPVRYEAFLKAVETDPLRRAENASEEIEFVKSRYEFYGKLEQAHKEGILPLKVTHNDTKLNNVMLDADTRRPVCVIDLDTVMPGYSVNDFGDSIRFGASTAAEDEKELSKVHFDINLFRIYTKGFLEGCHGSLTDDERMLLPTGAKMMTVECGMRFLTDYLLGDTYFKTKYSEHNLVRCRTQFKLVYEMEQQWEEMQRAVE